jgi:hypothetical protein
MTVTRLPPRPRYERESRALALDAVAAEAIALWVAASDLDRARTQLRAPRDLRRV